MRMSDEKKKTRKKRTSGVLRIATLMDGEEDKLELLHTPAFESTAKAHKWIKDSGDMGVTYVIIRIVGKFAKKKVTRIALTEE
jgi:hypothetical protein